MHVFARTNLSKPSDSTDPTWASVISEDHYLKAQGLEDKHEEARMKMLTAITKAEAPLILVPVLDHLIATKCKS